MRKVSAALEDDTESAETIEGLPLTFMLSLKHAQLSSADVERSFSKRKAMLRPNRRRLKVENLEKHLVINHYYGQLEEEESKEEDVVE